MLLICKSVKINEMLLVQCMDQPYQHEMDGFMMLGEFEDPYCNEMGDPSKYSMTTAATQTAVEPRSRKIKPVKHPGLKLQTPIAYQRDTDPSVIPIQRDGMGLLFVGSYNFLTLILSHIITAALFSLLQFDSSNNLIS